MTETPPPNRPQGHDAASNHGMPLLAYCETCKREFYGHVPRKFCDVPRCRGYLIHIDRGRHARA